MFLKIRVNTNQVQNIPKPINIIPKPNLILKLGLLFFSFIDQNLDVSIVFYLLLKK